MSEVAKKRGTKRKRSDVPKTDDAATRISGKLFHGLKEVRKAAKKAKTFETQKLVKKLKASRTKEDPNAKEVTELEAQLERLKHMDHEPIAHSALLTKVKKDHILSANADIQTAIAAHLTSNLFLPSPAGSPAAKVESRLLSSKTLAAEVHIVVSVLREVVQPSTKQPLKPDEDEVEDAEQDNDTAPPQKLPRLGARVLISGSHDGTGQDSDASEDELDQAGWESGSVDDEDGEDEWESGSVDDTRPGLPESGASSSEESPGSEDDEDGDLGRHAQDGNGGSRKVVREKLAKSKALPTKSKAPPNDPKAKSKATSAASTFLPSLSVGFIRGNSDSDWSDGEANIADDAPKKNRRGQRARRAIWEKKFGKNANHVKKERETAANDLRQLRRGAGRTKDGSAPRNVPPHMRKSAPGRTQFTAPTHDSGWAQSRRPAVENPTAAGAEKKGADKPLHPSWEAKRRLKEKQNPSIIPAQGKKIVF